MRGASDLNEYVKPRIIFHIDVNSAFLSWSAVRRLKEDPGAVDLRTVPSVVGGDQATRHGIVTAKSVPAKKYGIKTAEPVAKAMQKCPGLIVIRSEFDVYRKYSKAFISLLHTYTDAVEQVSIDEAFMDVTDILTHNEPISGRPDKNECKPGQPPEDLTVSCIIQEEAIALADSIRKRVREELGFTVNAGISVNRLLAKMASDFTKPDRTHTLFPEEIPAKMWPLPVGDLYGCGGKTAGRLVNMGIRTIGDAARTRPEILQSLLGEKGGLYLWRSANGKSSDRIVTERDEAKSCSNEITTAYDITDENYEKEIGRLLDALSRKVASRLQKEGVYANTVAVLVKTSDFRKRSMQSRLPDPAHDAETICKMARTLMDRLVLGDGVFSECPGIRLVGVKASDLSDGSYHQMNFTDYLEEGKRQEAARRADEAKQKEKRLSDMTAGLKKKYGETAIHKGWPLN